jgi:hypothetical protein
LAPGVDDRGGERNSQSHHCAGLKAQRTSREIRQTGAQIHSQPHLARPRADQL